MSRAVRAFTVPPAVGLELAIVAVAQQRVVVGIRFQIHAPAIPSVAPGRAAARNIFLPAKRHAPVPAVPRLHIDFRFVNKHWNETPNLLRARRSLSKTIT